MGVQSIFGLFIKDTHTFIQIMTTNMKAYVTLS